MSKFCKTITNGKYLPRKEIKEKRDFSARVIQKKFRENIDKARKKTQTQLNKDAPPQTLESTTSAPNQNPSTISESLPRSSSTPLNQNGGGFYSAVGEGAIAGMPIYKGYFDMTPPIFKGELLRSTLQDVSCGPQASSQSGGKKRRTKKRKLNKRKRRTKNKRKSKKNRRYKKRTSKRTYRK